MQVLPAAVVRRAQDKFFGFASVLPWGGLLPVSVPVSGTVGRDDQYRQVGCVKRKIRGSRLKRIAGTCNVASCLPVVQIAQKYDAKVEKRSRFEIGMICARLIPSLRVLPVISLSGACIRQKTPNSSHFAFAFAGNIRTMI